ncbi:spore coat protein U domain-containing protein [Sphaerospermopsis aphanizomenoides BCCUSP55]|uniref:Csu type fimbrial protein n=1 Tax=Sphaerospermopsis aphanizomenoides TaxID=459663 RepID=UPI001908259A|nr:spore coat U domain-containing protein [Sphaerospermopsis aphanizomenoides]MBK1986620.1 spore coat protein U domain-containing protein [Sphaerospermopsis aphanizomenoides BCCUSP55]
MLRRFSLASALLVAGSIVAATAPAMAGTSTANLSASASVTANCTISTSALSFGAYDPLSGNASSPLDGTGAVTITCTNGASAVIMLGQGSNADTGSTDAAPLRRLKDAGTNYLSYSLYKDAGHATVWGNTAGSGLSQTGNGTAQTNTIYGRVTSGQNVSAGSYTDTVTATVSF